jgi:hypothetical protein
MSDHRWTPAKFHAKAIEITARLNSWHIVDCHFPIQTITEEQSRPLTRKTLDDFTRPDSDRCVDRPKTYTLIRNGDGTSDTIAYLEPDKLTDRTTTLGLITEFRRHLEAETGREFDGLRNALENVLRQQAYQIVPESWIFPSASTGLVCLIGCKLNETINDGLVGAAALIRDENNNTSSRQIQRLTKEIREDKIIEALLSMHNLGLKITRDEVSKRTKISKGLVSGSDAWISYKAKKDEEKGRRKPSQATDGILSRVKDEGRSPFDKAADKEELERAIEEQLADMNEDDRRLSRRRHDGAVTGNRRRKKK